MQVGYVRVSSVDQCLDRQLDKVELDKVYEEKISGKGRDRPQLKECMNYLREGDTLHVHSMDRLSRSLKDLLNIVSELTDKKVKVKFHTENMEFAGKDIKIIEALIAFEATTLKERQAIGRAKAVSKGVKMGRQSLSTYKIEEIKRRRSRGDSTKDIAKKMKISRTTVYNYI